MLCVKISPLIFIGPHYREHSAAALFEARIGLIEVIEFPKIFGSIDIERSEVTFSMRIIVGSKVIERSNFG